MDSSKSLSVPEEALTRLEERLALLERLVMGTKMNAENESNMVDPLLEIITKLRALTAGRDNYNQLSKHFNEYGPFINKIDQFDGSTEPDAVKWELILAQEDKLREKSVLLESIVAKQKIIDSSAFKEIDPLKPRMEKLRSIIDLQNQEADKLSRETQDLIRSYNRLLAMIKNRMLCWDKKLTALEATKNSKRPKGVMTDFD